MGGHAVDLVTWEIEEVGIVWVEPGAPAEMPCFNGGGGVNWIRGPGGDVKRVRLSRKTPTHLVGFEITCAVVMLTPRQGVCRT